MNESFTLLVCTKEDFNDFKAVDPSKDTAPVKVERRPSHSIFPAKKYHSFETHKEPSSPSFDDFSF